jgi:hypothetical protein
MLVIDIFPWFEENSLCSSGHNIPWTEKKGFILLLSSLGYLQ